MLYGKREWLEKMPPYQGGGEMIDEVRCEGITYNEPPHRFEAGTPPIVEAIGLGAAVRFMMELGRERIQAHEAALSAYAHERLRGMNSLRIIGQAPGQGRDHRLRDEGRARPRRRDGDRPPGRRGPGRHPLRHAAARRASASPRPAVRPSASTTRMAEVDKLAEALQKAEALFA